MDRDSYNPFLRFVLPLACAGFVLASCGGGGGGSGTSESTPQPSAPPGPSYALSGTLSIAPTAAVDSDSNDVNQIAQNAYRVNDDPARAQAITSPVLLVGTVNEVRTGPAGNNFTPGDVDDWFKVDLVAGQVVELEFAADPTKSDVDLYVSSSDGVHFGASNGVASRYECVRINTSMRYYVNVSAFRNASIYNLRIGAPGSAASCAVSANATPAAADQLLAKALPIDAEQARIAQVRLQTVGVRGAMFSDGAEGMQSASVAPAQRLHEAGSSVARARFN